MKILEESVQRQKIFFNVAVLALSLFSLSHRQFSFDKTTAFENFMVDMFSPMQSSVTYVKTRTSNFFEHYIMNINASQDNTKLQKVVADLKDQVFSYEQVSKENKRLKELLQFGGELDLQKVLAQIIAWDANSDFKVLRINKGKADGIELQSSVVTSVGLVGYIFRLTDHYADIITILDPNNRVDALVERTRSHGIVEGYSRNRAIMKYLAGTEPVILGDLVLSSGLGNIYPKGLKIGKITKVERESYGITQSIEIEPVVNFSTLEEVVVLVGTKDEIKEKEWKALDDAEGDEQ
ncbi:MAG: rod shape-determining protein MreC [Bacteriovoracaceae bacterium]|jgi:rod shape-determining protein MreC